jgi:hypothetical protein
MEVNIVVSHQGGSEKVWPNWISNNKGRKYSLYKANDIRQIVFELIVEEHEE